MTLALLITAATGAWAEDSESITTTLPEAKTGSVEFTGTHFKITGQRADGDGMNLGSSTNRTITISALNGEIITKVEMTISHKYYSWEWEVLSTKGNVSGEYTTGKNLTLTDVDVSEVTLSASNTTTGYLQFNKFKIFYTMPAGTMTLNADNTEATMEMPASDVTVTYELVRDLTTQVTFGGIPTGDGLVVKNNGTAYEFVTAPTFTLTDALADNADIISDEGITLTTQKKGDGDTWQTLDASALAAGYAPGTYRLVATATADGPYDGTIYSAEFTVVEQYDLAVKPADEYSKGKVESVTVGTESVTIDANTGEATKTGITPDTEVKIKAKRGYVIEKVEAKKGAGPEGVALGESTVGMIVGSDGLAYAADDKDNLPEGVTVAAKVCYVDGNGHGLALALADEGEMNWSTAQTTCAAHTPAITGGTWKLATKDEWSNMITAAGSHTALRDGFSSVGGTNMQSDFYWSSTAISYGAWYYTFDGGSWTNGGKGSLQYVRACLAF